VPLSGDEGPGTVYGKVLPGQARIRAVSPRGDLTDPDLTQIKGDWEQAARLWTGLGCPYEAAMALLDATDEAALRGKVGNARPNMGTAPDADASPVAIRSP